MIDIFLGKKQVGRSLRRYNDFEAFHEVLSTNYRNMDLGMEEFPSKYQLIGKDEKRRQYF